MPTILCLLTLTVTPGPLAGAREDGSQRLPPNPPPRSGEGGGRQALLPLSASGRGPGGGVVSGAPREEKNLPDSARMEALAKEDPIAFLENCLARYDREVKGYSLTMQKQERIQGKLQPREVIEVHFKHGPAANGHSVFMRWVEGARLAARVLYVDGENDNKMVVKPAGVGGFLTVARDPDGLDARRSGRYTVKEFGLRFGLQGTLDSYRAARKDDALHVEYLGRKKIKEAGEDRKSVVKGKTVSWW